ncbi:MAG: alpha/beta hydrolase [Anaerolineales bacterium]
MSDNNFIKNPQLDGDNFYWEGNPIGFLLIHGFTATTTEVRLIAEKLHQLGYTTAAPLLPGHGTNPVDMNRSTWPMWLEKVKSFYEKLLRECDQVYVIGESMGALLALELAVQHQEIPGLILAAPAIKVNNLWIAHLIAPFRSYLWKKGKDDDLAWKGYIVEPLKAAVQLHKLQKHTRKQLGKINQPTLVLSGEYDHAIAPDSIQIIMQGINSSRKQHIHMNHSSHCILLDQELEQVTNHILTFTGLLKNETKQQ